MELLQKLNELEERMKRAIKEKAQTKSPEFQEAYNILTNNGKHFYHTTPTMFDPSTTWGAVVKTINTVCEAQGKPEDETLRQIMIAYAISRGTDADDIRPNKIKTFVGNKIMKGLEKLLAKSIEASSREGEKFVREKFVKYLKIIRETSLDKTLFTQTREEFYTNVLPEVKKILY